MSIVHLLTSHAKFDAPAVDIAHNRLRKGGWHRPHSSRSAAGSMPTFFTQGHMPMESRFTFEFFCGVLGG